MYDTTEENPVKDYIIEIAKAITDDKILLYSRRVLEDKKSGQKNIEFNIIINGL